ncbi:hypothetical protein LNAOJCKE_4101 [Methylorubrum aminovorans]|uniref:Uncharacterized protein n=1 Tax=Methylorubrum aminovorans TaxID=269069 RepID=A0ABQ4UK30_9HYPH|nr:hypothetical protein LNAOJCKE_4101 [Methylorubrum aminovorans]
MSVSLPASGLLRSFELRCRRSRGQEPAGSDATCASRKWRGPRSSCRLRLIADSPRLDQREIVLGKAFAAALGERRQVAANWAAAGRTSRPGSGRSESSAWRSGRTHRNRSRRTGGLISWAVHPSVRHRNPGHGLSDTMIDPVNEPVKNFRTWHGTCLPAPRSAPRRASGFQPIQFCAQSPVRGWLGGGVWCSGLTSLRGISCSLQERSLHGGPRATGAGGQSVPRGRRARLRRVVASGHACRTSPARRVTFA